MATEDMDCQKWFEKLPSNCPPPEAEHPTNFLCFRLSTQNPPNESDYFSQRKIYPDKNFHVNECRARSLSIFNSKKECENIKRLPAHKDKFLISMRLYPECGMIQKTGKSQAHYSWWVQAGFLSHIVIEEL